MYTYIYLYLAETIWCCLYVFAFRADNSRLYNLSEFLSLQPLILPVALFPGMESRASSPIHVGMSTGVVTVLVLFRQPSCFDFVVVASPPYVEDTTISQQLSWYFGSKNMSTSLSLKYKGCVVDVSIGIMHLTVSCPRHFTSCGFL